jgi:serine/threonine-protein kinase
MQPVEKDFYIGPLQVEHLASIYAQLGESDLAVDQLEYLLSIPSKISIPVLRLDPIWDPLRDHPRFQALLESG